MMKELMDLIEKKKAKGEVIKDEREKSAKMAELDDIDAIAKEAMGGDVKGLKKVTVMAPDQKGLEEGLEKASEIAEEMPAMEKMAKSEDEEESEDMEEKPEMSKDEILAKIEELKKALEKMA